MTNKTYYVDIHKGSNTNDGSSSDKAFATLLKAHLTAMQGDKIHLIGNPSFVYTVMPWDAEKNLEIWGKFWNEKILYNW